MDFNIIPTGTEQQSLDRPAAQGPAPNTVPCFKALLFLKGHKKNFKKAHTVLADRVILLRLPQFYEKAELTPSTVRAGR